ncbi:MAG: hypothetical protein CVV53_07280, partial [Spirochaetae bacterium HGW-Spirochaetae-9]
MLVVLLLISTGVSIVKLAAQEIIPPPEETLTSIPEVPLELPPVEPDFPSLPFAAEGLGAEAWYYEAKKLEQTGTKDVESEQVVDFMYRLAFQFGEKAAAKEAGRALIGRAKKTAGSSEVQALSSLWLEYFGADWDVYRTLITDRLETKDYEAALKAIADLRLALPSTAKLKASELSFYEYSSLFSMGDFSWWTKALPYLKQTTLDSWAGQTLRLASFAPDMDEATRHLCLMRAAYRDKEYTEAAEEASKASSALHDAGVARLLISEAGKSFINAGAKDAGIAFFMEYFPELLDNAAGEAAADTVIASMGADKPEERLWVAAYYLARLWLSAGRSQDAAILFLDLSERAPSDGDADGALWYWLDITMRRLTADDIMNFEAGAESEAGARRSLELGALVEASLHWKNPAYFDDIVESYDRLLLKEKSWDDVLSLFILIGEKVSPGMRTRLLYQCGRLVEENMALARDRTEEERAELAGEYFRKILENKDAEEYYRTMSAWRLRLTPPYLANMPALSKPAGSDVDNGAAARPSAAALLAASAAAGPAPNGNGTQASLSLIRNYLNYDLDEMASAIALNFLGSVDRALIVGLAFDLSAEGQHNAALRLARDAVNRGAGSQYPELYGLIYPKAWNDIVAVGAAIPGIPEALAYGIIRSESVFDPKVVSYAGAVGLAQLMPATAAETARGLKMAGYSLTDPADNIRIGMTYYSYMMGRFGGKPMRAMFAYNAGPSRMMAWAKESGELADDILLETLHLAQPRQYAKNIIQASLAYGKIHYG